MKKKIILVSGDPNSINSEIIWKSWKRLPNTVKKKLFLISNYKLLKDQFRRLNYKINIERIENIFNSSNYNKLKIR